MIDSGGAESGSLLGLNGQAYNGLALRGASLAPRKRGSFEPPDAAQTNAPGIAGKLVLGVK